MQWLFYGQTCQVEILCGGHVQGHAKPGHETSDWRMDVWPGSVVFWGLEQ
jgi:hypothetical protein